MSRLSKSDLKIIVKECLLEILAEGLAEPATQRKQVMKQKNSKKEKLRESIISRRSLEHIPEGVSRGNRIESQRSYLDAISFGSDQNTDPEPRPQNNQILERVSRMTSDPILNEMLADTAQTTLPAQMSADRARGSSSATPPADKAARIVQSSTPEDLFGDSASSKWATLAFGS